ncbi:DinB family protein [Merismopedia glauca]|uniref:Damage-inducible protein DinB n=1 Tax=Merismopedia glauca CCAP 1448/3 TaxID=1296344 RepID=A0A2T1C1B9_9CYAN|nr:DinB family protein [Merismopedia glauca]PSB02070.1 damage-inducible protein DinB [Merismopedia glauca CCAP 1448/3]
MNLLPQIQLLSQYNRWMNQKVYQAASGLNEDVLIADKGAFFGSMLGTLNHILVADIIWLKRFSTHPTHHPILDSIRQTPQPKALNQILYSHFYELTNARHDLDELIILWCQELAETDLDVKLTYQSMKGETGIREFGSLVLHFFNHQSHHRGQVTTLLSQAGVDVGVTDLLVIIPNFAETVKTG